MDSSPSVKIPLVEQQNTITCIDSELYKAACKGQIDPFNSYTEPLDLLLTPTKNTILHIHITQQLGGTVSISFMERILAKCPSLLLQTNNRGETPLHMAARHGHHNAVRFLIDSAKSRHQDIETGAGAARVMMRMENIDKETALHEAVRYDNPIIVRILTEEDPDFTYSANKLGETPLPLAVEREYSKMVFQILDTCTSPAFDGPIGRTALHEAIIRNSSAMTAKIIGANKTLAKNVDQLGWAPLHYASFLGNLSIVKKLLECDKSVAYVGDKAGMIPLHLAVACGDINKQVVFSILEHCPDCHELVDHKGRNVLHFAVMSESETMLTHMLEGSNNNNGYDFPLMTNLINQKDVDGNTPLHVLARKCVDNDALIVHPLVDKMAVNNGNHTPRDVISVSSGDHDEGFKGITLNIMKGIGGYKPSWRNVVIELEEQKSKFKDMEEIDRIKASHIIVAALVVTVTFTAGFTMPGGYDGDKGTAILSRKGAFVTFLITDTLALIFSTCALFCYYIMEFRLTRRSKTQFIGVAGLFIMFSLFLMLIAFTSAVFAVLQHSTYLQVIICFITSFSILVCYFPFKRMITDDMEKLKSLQFHRLMIMYSYSREHGPA